MLLCIPTMSFTLFSETSIRLGMRLYFVSFISSLRLLPPVLGSQNFTVPSQEPLANFKLIIKKMIDQQQRTKFNKCYVHNQTSQIYVCLTQECRKSRIICSKCIDEQEHRHHFIVSEEKFKQMIDKYKQESQKTKIVISQKMNHFRKRVMKGLENFESELLKSLNLIQSHERSRQNFEVLAGSKKWENFHTLKLNGYEQVDKIIQLLQFFEEAISEQIQDIFDKLQVCVEEKIENINFITNNPNLLFNPQRMYDLGVGLTLNRNIVESLNSENQKYVIAQTSFNVHPTRCFKIVSLSREKGRIMLGAANYELIALKNYENADYLTYSLCIDSGGKVRVYNGSSFKKIDKIKITSGDTIKILVNQSQKYIRFVKGRQKLFIIQLSLSKEDLCMLYPFTSVHGEQDQVQLIDSRQI